MAPRPRRSRGGGIVLGGRTRSRGRVDPPGIRARELRHSAAFPVRVRRLGQHRIEVLDNLDANVALGAPFVPIADLMHGRVFGFVAVDQQVEPNCDGEQLDCNAIHGVRSAGFGSHGPSGLLSGMQVFAASVERMPELPTWAFMAGFLRLEAEDLTLCFMPVDATIPTAMRRALAWRTTSSPAIPWSRSRPTRSARTTIATR